MKLGVIETIWAFLKKLTANGLTVDIVFFIGIGFLATMVIFYLIKSAYSYESKLERQLERVNRWLYTHQTITEDNLIEFNSMMKGRKSPKLFRYHWQQYMLYREGVPSKYLSVYNCIEKPLHTSSYLANIKNFSLIMWITAGVTFVFSLLTYIGGGGIESGTALSLSTITASLIGPAIIAIVGILFIMLLRSMQNFNLASLYQNFHLFNRYIDKASIGIPKYVDFEILFTKKEIKNGIPILGEYLEKRARQEAEELEEARLNAVKLEEYDFASSGIDSSLVLDRAMKESEIFLNARTRIYAEIQQFETEINSLTKNYENNTREYQRKLQASKENLERLRIQQEESTNRIEGNYIRKQQQDEIKKQELLEKDQEDNTTRYNQETRVLKEEIAKRRADLAEKKEYVTSAMLSEYQTFSNKVYKTIFDDLTAENNNKLKEYITQKELAEKEVEKYKEINDVKDQVIEELKNALHQTAEAIEERAVATLEDGDNNLDAESQMYEPETSEINNEAEETAKQEELPVQEIKNEEVEQQTEEIASEPETDGFYDDKGYYWFNDGTYYDANNLYHDLDGTVYNSDSEVVATNQVVETYAKPTESEGAEQPTEEIIEETNVEQEEPLTVVGSLDDLDNQQTSEENNQVVEETTQENEDTTQEVVEERVQEQTEEEPELKGFYDENGYYWFEDGRYYDANGNFHDALGNVYNSDFELIEENAVVEQMPPFPEELDIDEQAQEEESLQESQVQTELTEEQAQERKEDLPKEPEQNVDRKRGRPKKDAEGQIKKTLGKHSRSKKQEKESPKKEQLEKPKQEQTGKRGRPKKAQVEEPKQATASKRGRPRKETTEPKPTTAKRGRPKKETTKEPKTSLGKRGRPKKNLDSLNNDINSESKKLKKQERELLRTLGSTLKKLSDNT